LGRAGRGLPTFWLVGRPYLWPAHFLGDVNFFFLYIAIMTGEIFSNEQEMRTKRAQNAANGGLDSPKLVWRPGFARTR